MNQDEYQTFLLTCDIRDMLERIAIALERYNKQILMNKLRGHLEDQNAESQKPSSSVTTGFSGITDNKIGTVPINLD